MEEILIRIKDHDKLESLMNFLLSVDYIEVKKISKVTKNKSKDFFSTAGLWKNRDIDLKTIRAKAWKHGSL